MDAFSRLRKILTIRSAVPVFVVIIAFVTTFIDVKYFPRDRTVLALLGFLAVNALIDRVYLSGDLKNLLSDVHTIISKLGLKDIAFRGQFGSTEELILSATKEVWVSGVALDTVSRLTGLFDKQVKSGVQIRFLCMSSEEHVIADAASYFSDDAGGLALRLKTNLENIYKKLIAVHPGKVTIRVLSHRPAVGYFIVDPLDDRGFMRVETYISHTEYNQRPMLQLFSSREKEWFNLFCSDFQNLWDDAQEWPTTSTSLRAVRGDGEAEQCEPLDGHKACASEFDH